MSRDRGMVLVAALALVMMAAFAAAAVIAAARSEQWLARNRLTALQERAAGEAGLYVAAKALLDHDDPAWLADGTPRQIRFGGRQLRVAIQDEAGRMDVNAASPDLLQALFHAAGLKGRQADALADAVADWRDRDDLKRASGAEEAEYRRGGLGFRPRNDNFGSVDEVRRVFGVTPDLFARLSGMVTIYSQKAAVDPRYAPRQLLRHLPGMEDGHAGDLIAARRQPDGPGSAAVAAAGDLAARAYRIRVSAAKGTGDGGYGLQAVIRMIGNPSHPYGILAVQQGGRPME